MPHASFDVQTDPGLSVADVTDQVAATLPATHDGTATVFATHTTAAVTVNEPESHLLEDLVAFLEDVVPDDGWRHDEIDDNAAAHLRATLLGPSTTVPVASGSPALGTWQAVLLVDCDGPRRRTVRVTW